MILLKSTDGDGQLLQFPLFKLRMTIGRDPSNDIQLNDSDVSRWHALLIREADGLVLRDMQSTNGVFVNNLRMHDPVTLRDGDQMIIGSNLFVVVHDNQVEDELGQTIAFSSGEFAPLRQKNHTAGNHLNQRLDASGNFDTTVLRSKVEMFEQVLEKKKQAARFPRLEVQSELIGERCYLLAMPVFRIGRGAACHLRINDRLISTAHAEILCQAEGNFIVDQDSSNGTIVNGRRIKRQQLTEGDVIEMPKVRMVYRHQAGLRGRFTEFLKSLFPC